MQFQGPKQLSTPPALVRSRTTSGSFARSHNDSISDAMDASGDAKAVAYPNKRPAPSNESQSRSRATQQNDQEPPPAVQSVAARSSSVDSALSGQSGNSIQVFKQAVACGPMIKWTAQARRAVDVNVTAPATDHARASNYTFSNQVKTDGKARRVFQPLALAAVGGISLNVEENDDDDWKSWRSGGGSSISECSDNGSFTPRRSESNASHQGSPRRTPSILRMQEYLVENHDTHTASAVRMELLYSGNRGPAPVSPGPPNQSQSPPARIPNLSVQANPPASLPPSQPVSPPARGLLSPLSQGQLQRDSKLALPAKQQEIKKQPPARVFNFAFSSQEKPDGQARRVFQPLAAADAVEAHTDEDDDWKSWRSEGSNISECSDNGSFTPRRSPSSAGSNQDLSGKSTSATRMQDFLKGLNEHPEAPMSIFLRQDHSSEKTPAEVQATSGQTSSHGQPQAKQNHSDNNNTINNNTNISININSKPASSYELSSSPTKGIPERAGNCVFAFSQEQGQGPLKRCLQRVGVGPDQLGGGGTEHLGHDLEVNDWRSWTSEQSECNSSFVPSESDSRHSLPGACPQTPSATRMLDMLGMLGSAPQEWPDDVQMQEQMLRDLYVRLHSEDF
ncbi:unnamed protein product [Polarella glacialis]|uniref:Uncharacterized protein n=1 Tax=Polarella glacialis TaxID=89957 RepID=A0A813JFA1_POLGL|nr:unnamed protein product [Polarella glacialis]